MCELSTKNQSAIVLWQQPASAATSLPFQNKVLCNHNNVKLGKRGTWKFLLSGVTPVIILRRCDSCLLNQRRHHLGWYEPNCSQSSNSGKNFYRTQRGHSSEWLLVPLFAVKVSKEWDKAKSGIKAMKFELGELKELKN